jgi:hypothetical protein
VDHLDHDFIAAASVFGTGIADKRGPSENFAVDLDEAHFASLEVDTHELILIAFEDLDDLAPYAFSWPAVLLQPHGD